MNTRQLRHFLAVMDLGSLAAAAERVHLSPPALSRSLRALEDGLRVPLFDRQDRRLTPTPYAHAYAERARRMVFDENEALRLLALMRAGESGSLSFGMGSSISQLLLSPMMLQLTEHAPGLRLSAMVQSSDVLYGALLSERLDFIIGDIRIAAHDPEMAVEPVYASTFGWYARSGHPLAGQARVGIAALLQHPCVLAGYTDPQVMRRMGELYGLSMPLEEHFMLNTDDVGTMHALVVTSNAIAPSTDLAVLSALQAGRVVALDVAPALELEMTLGIIRRAGRTLVPAADRAFAIVRRFFTDAADEISRQRGRARPAAPRKRAPGSGR